MRITPAGRVETLRRFVDGLTLCLYVRESEGRYVEPQSAGYAAQPLARAAQAAEAALRRARKRALLLL